MSDFFNASGCAGSTKQEAVLFAYLGRLVVPLLLGSLVRGEHAVVQKLSLTTRDVLSSRLLMIQERH
jgi:hypothetical protein